MTMTHTNDKGLRKELRKEGRKVTNDNDIMTMTGRKEGGKEDDQGKEGRLPRK